MLATQPEERSSPRRRGSTTTGRGHARIPALDGLRGAAVVGVVLYHAGHLRGGFLGVDLFFVLSGYLITTVLLRSARRSGGIDLRKFWSRRARRLLPALIVMLVIVVPVYSHWFATKPELLPLRHDGIASTFYVTNWAQIVHGQSYFTATLAESPLRHVWSLAVEEQFYLLWPLAVLAAARRGGARAVMLLAAFLGVLSAGLTIILGATKVVSYNSLYLGTHTRAAALLAGAALAAWFRVHGPPKGALVQRRLESAAMVSVVVLGVMWVTMRVTSPSLYVGGLAVSAVAGTILVASAATSTDGPLTRVLSIAPLRFLGTISYGIYLWSWPITQMVSVRHTSLGGWTLVAAQVVLTLAAAMLSWVVIERPILSGAIKPPWSGRVLAVGAVAAAIAVLLPTAGATALPSTAVPLAGYLRSTVPGAPRLMVVGDSVPNRITEEGIIPLRNELGVSVVDRTAPGCILLRSIGEVKGTEGNIRQDVHPCDIGWGQLVHQFKPQVVLMMFGEFPNDQVLINGKFNLPCTPDYQRQETAKLNQGIAELTSTGARVVIATAPGSTVSWVLKGVPAGMNARVACMNRLYARVAHQHANVSIVDFAKLICPGENDCRNDIDGVNLRVDTLHFRGPSAELVARWLVPRALTGRGGSILKQPSPFCARVQGIEGKISQLVASTSTTGASDPLAERTALINGMRSLLPPDLAAQAPPEIRTDLAVLATHWGDLLDRAALLPLKPSPADLTQMLGDLAGPVTRVAAWTDKNCT